MEPSERLRIAEEELKTLKENFQVLKDGVETLERVCEAHQINAEKLIKENGLLRGILRELYLHAQADSMVHLKEKTVSYYERINGPTEQTAAQESR